MRGKIFSLVAAAALLASVGAANAATNAPANAKSPVTLTDNQLDKVTAGATAADILANSTASLNSIVANANSPAALNNLLAITAQTVGFLMTP
jgi:UDP-N-acetylglucosamine enolpyruvyl transferase